jgi:EAL domain-containing protein (putative c-di-GMP-specific phosphodiesterase class I)
MDLPWHEALMRPSDMGVGVGVAEFVDALYQDFAPAFVDGGVLRRITQWQRENEYPSRVSINIHPESLLNAGFLDEAIAAAATNALTGHEICLELVEYGECSNKSALTSNAQALRDAGILIALDDFGTRINCFDLCGTGIIDILKIDMSVTQEMCDNKNQLAVVRSIVTLAHGIGAVVIAEGVETRSQLAALVGLGVEYAQGYLLHLPELKITDSNS